MFCQPTDKLAQVIPCFNNFIYHLYSTVGIMGSQKVGHTEVNFLINNIERLQQVRSLDIAPAERAYLVEYTLSIPKRM